MEYFLEDINLHSYILETDPPRRNFATFNLDIHVPCPFPPPDPSHALTRLTDLGTTNYSEECLSVWHVKKIKLLIFVVYTGNHSFEALNC